MSNHISLIAAAAMAGALGSACSGGNGKAIPGTGGTPTPLPPCQVWPDAQGPAFSIPLRRPSRFESVRRAANGQTLYGVGTWTNAGLQQRALIRSTDDGQTWCPLATPSSPLSVAPAPAADLTLWIVTGATGPAARDHDILRSVDGGASWQPARGDLPSDVGPQSILLVGPTGGEVAWIATSDGFFGAASTRDGGRTWTRIALAAPAAPVIWSGGPLAIDPARPSRILVAPQTFDPSTGSWSGRLLRSVDWGVTWSDIAPPPLPVGSQPLGFLTIDAASTIYAADATVTHEQMWRSTDGGATWRAALLPAEVGSGTPMVVDGGMAGHMVILSVDVSAPNMWETLDSGDSWREATLPDGFNPRQGSTLLAAGPAPGQFLTSTPIGLQATTDVGSTWIARAVVPASAAGIAISPVDPDVLWALTPIQSARAPASGRTLRSSDGGRTWKVLSGTHPFVDICADPTDPKTAFAIDQTGVFGTTDGGDTWRPLATILHPPRHVVMAPDGKVLYVVTSAGIESSEDRGATWSHVLDIDVLPAVSLQMAVSPVDGRHAVVLAAQRTGSNSAFMIETRDAGATAASTVAIPGLAGQLQFTSIALVASGVILVGGQSGILRSSDGGATWMESNQGIEPGAPRALPGTPIWSILAPPASPGEVWALDGRAFRSLDSGAHWMPWPAPISSIPASLSALTVIAGDPGPGKRLVALASPQSATTGLVGPIVASGMTLLEVRP